ncbi:hypothetical protein [Oceanicola sp. S124]|uniref:hypothetical protein n=1 Tax=Oceanicola sp. S124 TaxID=1042378 RepID=UPI0002F399A3|nr:hypothetical protein [Oceanicola sp. S124]
MGSPCFSEIMAAHGLEVTFGSIGRGPGANAPKGLSPGVRPGEVVTPAGGSGPG